jgi:hypothetical protein
MSDDDPVFPDWMVDGLSDEFQDQARCLKNGHHGAALCQLLMETDIPLTPEQRRCIARDLCAFYLGVPVQRWQKQRTNDMLCQVMEVSKRQLKRAEGAKEFKGWQLEKMIADDIGLSVEAMGKRLYRARKRRRRTPR